MFKNYFILNRLSLELNRELKDYKIFSAFSQQKDTLTLQFIKGIDEKYLEISVNPGSPFICLRERFHRAKKNTIDFFQNYFPSKMISINIAEDDRVIRIKLDSCSMYFAIRGKYTNLILIDETGSIEAFKKSDETVLHDFAEEVRHINFTDRFKNGVNISFDKGKNLNEIVKKDYPFVGKDILNEIKYRSDIDDHSENLKTLNKILCEIATETPAVFYDEGEESLYLAVETFHVFPYTEIRNFESVNSAFNYFLSKEFYLDNKIAKEKKTKKVIERELQKLSSKLNNLKSRIDRGSKEDEYNKLGNLLLINLKSIRHGQEEITVKDIYSGDEEIKIKLKASLSPQKNVDYYFDKAKSERIQFVKSKELYSQLKKEFENLKKTEEELNKAGVIEDINKIMSELKIQDNKTTSSKDDLTGKFKHYVIEDKYNVYVGKDSRSNDLLTTKFAKQNDYWFHARSVPGSHVVLRVENTKEIMPKNILKKTAALAAFHSKAKTAGLAPVSYTQKKYVVKRKGMEPGKVALLREDTLLVKPEVPQGCEYQSNE
jgi:predicted ribosome quality control (RQC) complex YloA/Tae2 family protein